MNRHPIVTLVRSGAFRATRNRHSPNTPATPLAKIAAHPLAFGAGERGARYQAYNALGGETPDAVARIAALDARALDAAAERYLAELHALAPDKARIVDKMQLQLPRPCRVDAARCADNPLYP